MKNDAETNSTVRILALDLARRVCREYRLDEAQAVDRIVEMWLRNDSLRQAIAETADIPKIKRTRAYKEAARAAKKGIYFELRRYRRQDPELIEAIAELESLAPQQKPELARSLLVRIAGGHVSMAERLPHLDLFVEQLRSVVGSAVSVLDIGAGVAPLLFPFDALPRVRSYVACDRDKISVRALDAYADWRGDRRLKAVLWDISEDWTTFAARSEVKTFDIALMLKLLPVVERQTPALVNVLANAPAQGLLLTGSKEALTKRKEIGRRELAALERFIDLHGLKKVGSFETPDEIGILAQA